MKFLADFTSRRISKRISITIYSLLLELPRTTDVQTKHLRLHIIDTHQFLTGKHDTRTFFVLPCTMHCFKKHNDAL
ncbi:MAG: hypothetical protein Q7T66_05300 [Herminiimonas sp.]|nr:hypothetical protein [Herminiimonas sp.]